MGCHGCCVCWRQEFRIRNFGLKHENPRTFVESQYGPSIVYVLWRLLAGAYFAGLLVYNGATDKKGAKWFTLLTNWCFIWLTLNLAMQAITSTVHYAKYKRCSADSQMYPSMPWIFRVVWVLNNVTITAVPIVCIAFWSTVYHPGWKLTIVNTSTHGVNGAYMLIDMFVSGLPVRLLHVFHPIIFFAVYFLFTIVYWQAGGTSHTGKAYLYGVINYPSNPGGAAGGIVLLVFLGVPAFFLAAYVLYKLRLLLFTKCCNPQREEDGGNHIDLRHV